jgi:hypothetical protein
MLDDAAPQCSALKIMFEQWCAGMKGFYLYDREALLASMARSSASPLWR